MSLNFETVDKILKEEFGLESVSSISGKYVRHSYFYKDKYIYTKKSEVLREVAKLKRGGIGGYIYVGHLNEYKNHPQKDSRGQFKIGDLTEQEFRGITTKVTKEYK